MSLWGHPSDQLKWSQLFVKTTPLTHTHTQFVFIHKTCRMRSCCVGRLTVKEEGCLGKVHNKFSGTPTVQLKHGASISSSISPCLLMTSYSSWPWLLLYLESDEVLCLTCRTSYRNSALTCIRGQTTVTQSITHSQGRLIHIILDDAAIEGIYVLLKNHPLCFRGSVFKRKPTRFAQLGQLKWFI